MKHLNVLVLGGLVAVLLSACHGSSYHGTDMNSPPPAMQGDAFTASVQSTVTAAPEDVEPISVETIVATEVDDKEPEEVM